jgi:hypothetical protein
MKFRETNCCALGQICEIGNDTTKEEIHQLLKDLFHEQEVEWIPADSGGQTAVFTVTTPAEEELANKLAEMGFKSVLNSHDAMATQKVC